MKPTDLRTALRPYRGRPVYLEAVAGNNGDDLIMRGAERALDRLELERVDTPDRAELILINGSFKSDFWPMAIEQIRSHSERFPDTPLVVLPSTYLFKPGAFEAAFAGRRAPAHLFCRERYSLRHLQGKKFPVEVRLGLDDDMAFWLRGSGWIKRLRERARERHLLVVERADHERSTAGTDSQPASVSGSLASTVYRRTPAALTQPVVNLIERHRARRRPLTPFARAARKMVEHEYPDKVSLPVLAADIARRRYTNFDGYARLIAESGVVFTSRMHVGVLGGLLGKPTYLVQGSHYKIVGVYEQSLDELPNVTLVDRECRVIEPALEGTPA
ncbi:MAG: polysaccharide pyruvyl transferase family protein [Planctomycetota bacterium]|nr:MAG: polysaccharide pyruvyl transferase family protein [Planctomycetota bacterium]